MFQYPLTDRDGCNDVSALAEVRVGCVSVSSNGSRRVQLLADACIRLREGVSVSSNGSRRVQQYVAIESVTVIREFQYPLTDRDGCNNNLSCLNSFSLHVSVSSNGSRRVQHSVISAIVSDPIRFSIL